MILHYFKIWTLKSQIVDNLWYSDKCTTVDVCRVELCPKIWGWPKNFRPKRSFIRSVPAPSRCPECPRLASASAPWRLRAQRWLRCRHSHGTGRGEGAWPSPRPWPSSSPRSRIGCWRGGSGPWTTGPLRRTAEDYEAGTGGSMLYNHKDVFSFIAFMQGDQRPVF
jgi:hypothetical protein